MSQIQVSLHRHGFFTFWVAAPCQILAHVEYFDPLQVKSLFVEVISPNMITEESLCGVTVLRRTCGFIDPFLPSAESR